MWIRAFALVVAFLLHSIAIAAEPAAPEWVAAMKKVHEGFAGTSGHVAQFGDSITYSMAFWKPMSWGDPDAWLKEDGLPKKPEGRRWRDVIKGAGDDGKGPAAGNYSGWTVNNLLTAVPKVLAERKPEAAIIMIGTNDISGGKVPAGYEAGLEKVLRMCIEARCIPILSTIPPRRGRDEAVEQANGIIRALAKQHRVPLVDYHAAIVARGTDGKWDGTLISKDGVHPSGGNVGDYSVDNLKQCGYALRNWETFLVYREVYFRVLAAK